jgi:hypothetical protein
MKIMTKEWEDFNQFKDYDNLKYENRGNDNFFVDLMLNDGRVLTMYNRDICFTKYTFRNGDEIRYYFSFSSKYLGTKKELYASEIKKIRLTHTQFERYKNHKTYGKGTCLRCRNIIPIVGGSKIKCDILSFKYNMAKGKYPKPKVEIPFQKNEYSFIPSIY